MVAFLVQRVLSGLLLVALLTFLTFVVFNEIPTNPACLVVACGPGSTTPDAQIRNADHALGIDRSVFVQYGDFVWKLVRRGDFGTAWTTPSKVGTLIGRSLPVTASLVGGGMVLMMLLALPLGCIAAIRPRSPADRGLLAASVIGLAIHPFVLGLTIRDFFAVHFHLYSGYCPLTGKGPYGCGGPLDWASHLWIPWLVFALFFLPLYMRMLRVRLLETFSEPWISTARAKGASETRVVLHHALRNAIGPVLPMLAIDAGTAITAAIYIETVFGLNGLGWLAVSAFSGQAGGYDLPLTAGIVTVIGGFVVLLNVCADVAGAWLDPRIRAKTTSGLIPLPQAVASRPHVRLGLNVTLSALLVALLALAVTHKGTGGGSVDLGNPVQTLRVNWNDVTRLESQSGTKVQHGYLETRVTAIEFGRHGWRVHASLANKSPLTLHLLNPLGGTDSYPNQPMSLIVQTDNGSGRKQLQPLVATQFAPTLPQVLKPHSTWTGTFAGSDPVAHDTAFYVGFGRFAYAGSFDEQSFSTSTAKSAQAP
ncbi:MAG TPA: ABC transporter permease [Gaiellaceae bacterium]|jgi:peptide/nickel transport system permease protein|nr:ABC transporter permease [Gaiellaceae bacterium]